MDQGTIVVGAGIAGLECARRLQRAGRKVVVLERGRGVGGRCATRAFEGQPVDVGPIFFHGTDPGFLQALRQTPGATVLEGWPARVEGRGAPPHPLALEPSGPRFAFAEGVNVFARHLAEGLDIRPQTTVVQIALAGAGFEVATRNGAVFQGRDLVVALALEETLDLLGTLPARPGLAQVRTLLGGFSSVPALTLIAGYPLGCQELPWDLMLPEQSEALQLIAHDSVKRRDPRFLTLVYQARPKWSRVRLDQPMVVWTPELLERAGAILGPWALRPLWTYPHRWRHARVERFPDQDRPVLVSFDQEQTLGLAGDLFAAGGGVQAGWLSGGRLAEALLAGTRSLSSPWRPTVAEEL